MIDNDNENCTEQKLRFPWYSAERPCVDRYANWSAGKGVLHQVKYVYCHVDMEGPALFNLITDHPQMLATKYPY